MKKKYFLLIIPVLLGSCNSRYSSVPRNKITDERKQIAHQFLETLFRKCDEKDYSKPVGFNLSKRLENKFLSQDSLRSSCEKWAEFNGKITIDQFVSAHSVNAPKDFLDVYNFKIKTEKHPGIRYIHLGIYRDKNYLEVPVYTSSDENYFETMRKKYYKK